MPKGSGLRLWGQPFKLAAGNASIFFFAPVRSGVVGGVDVTFFLFSPFSLNKFNASS